MKKQLTRADMLHLGSMITYIAEEGDEKETCLGDLMYFDHGIGKGTYDSYFGKVDVTPEEAAIHNKFLGDARIKGLDESCEVGQGGFFYLNKDKQAIITFGGDVVTTDYNINGNSITFRRNGKTFRGRLGKHSDAFNFRRVS